MTARLQSKEHARKNATVVVPRPTAARLRWLHGQQGLDFLPESVGHVRELSVHDLGDHGQIAEAKFSDWL